MKHFLGLKIAESWNIVAWLFYRTTLGQKGR